MLILAIEANSETPPKLHFFCGFFRALCLIFRCVIIGLRFDHAHHGIQVTLLKNFRAQLFVKFCHFFDRQPFEGQKADNDTTGADTNHVIKQLINLFTGFFL